MISQIRQTQVRPNTLNKTLLKNNDNNNNKYNPSFKGPIELGTQFLNFLNTSPAIGACFVDFGFMVAPRTGVDLGRSLDAGVETGIREGSGTMNHAAAGAVGLGAGYLVSSAFNKANGVKAHLVFMDEKALNAFEPIVKASETVTGYDSKKYWEAFFNKLECFNTTEGGNSWKPLTSFDNLVKNSVDIMESADKNSYKVSKNTMAQLVEEVVGTTKAGSTFRIAGTDVEASLKDLTANAQSLLKAVKDKATHDGTSVVENLPKFLEGIKNRKVATVLAGLSIPLAIGMSVQPINTYLTKKRTGKEGFVGVEGREPDKSAKFKLLKGVVGFAMASWMISTILKKPSHLFTKTGTACKELLSNLQYKGMVPTLNQFKFIYGMTIFSRILACRDKNELRESSIKDTLGFANWLILGGFVSKLSARAFDKNLVNYDAEKYGKGFFNFVTKAIEKTHEEILYPVLKKAGISTIENGKTLPFRKLMSKVNDLAKGSNVEMAEVAQSALKQLKFKNYAQLLGYLYSGLVLGVGIPKLNIAITNHFEKKNNKSVVEQDLNTISNDYMLKLGQQNGAKTFGAFYNAM